MESAEPLYEFVLRVTGVDDYGASLQAIAGGKAPPPPEGARFDMSLEGSVDVPSLNIDHYAIWVSTSLNSFFSGCGPTPIPVTFTGQCGTDVTISFKADKQQPDLAQTQAAIFRDVSVSCTK